MARPRTLWLLGGALTLSLALYHAPASWMDRLLAYASEGRLRLADSQGRFWQGEGHLALEDGARGLQAIQALGWRFSAGLLPPRLELHLHELQHPVAHVTLRLNGVEVNQLAYELPVRGLAAAIPHPVARAGWRGTLSLQSSGAGCDWQQRCEGSVQVVWHQAGLDIVPEHALGSHQLDIRALGQQFALSVNSLEGPFRIKGDGQFQAYGTLAFRGRIEGEADLVDRLPNVMSRNARRTATPGVVEIEFP